MARSNWHKQLLSFATSNTNRTYKKGEIIIFQGEAPRHAYLIVSGVVKAYNLSLDGDEKPVAFYSEQDIFPAPWILSQVASSTYYHEAFTKDTKLAVVDRDQLMSLIRSDKDLLASLYDRQIKIQLAQSMHINALQYSRASDKLIYALHFLILNLGIKHSPTELELPINFTHQDLANLTGLTRETTAMELNKLKRSGVISYGTQQPYKLHLAKLAALINDQYISSLTESI